MKQKATMHLTLTLKQAEAIRQLIAESYRGRLYDEDKGRLTPTVNRAVEIFDTEIERAFDVSFVYTLSGAQRSNTAVKPREHSE